MDFAGHAKRRTPSVILVSLIDVLLVVLIFLMVTTAFKKAQPSLKLTLPDSKQASAGASDAKPFVVTVSTNFPFFFIEDKPVTLDRLQSELAAAVQRDPQVKLKIRADKASPWGEVVKVIDAGKSAKVAAIDALTERPASQ
jgi:biopolymer transport protein ExbD